MAVQYYYGAKVDRPDHRDLKKVYQPSEIPRYHPNVDLRKYVGHIYNQGELGSCTANALCAAYGLDLTKQSSYPSGGYYYFNPSRLFLYYNTREYEGTTYSDAGASIRDTVKALNRQGVCKETDWPYIIRKYTKKPPARCYEAAEGNNLCKYERLNQDIDQLRACLNDKCPFVFGFKVYPSFHNQKRGNMRMPFRSERSQEPLGSHAVVAVGYDDRSKRFILLNSWGRRWGDNGYFYMPYNFIKDPSMCHDFWKVTFACERGIQRSYGALDDNPDYRDFEEYYESHEIPEKGQYCLTEFVSVVYHQGTLMSCAANAVCSAYMILMNIEEDEDDDSEEEFYPSRLFLYYKSRPKKKKKIDCGCSIRRTLKAFNRFGVCDEEDWPYKANKVTKTPPRSCHEDVTDCTLEYSRLTCDLDQLRACISNSCPFVFGFDVFESFESNMKYGMMRMPSKHEIEEGAVDSHIVVAIGYNDNWRRFKCLNSFGSEWGDKGFFYMPYDFITNEDWCFDFWKIALADD